MRHYNHPLSGGRCEEVLEFYHTALGPSIDVHALKESSERQARLRRFISEASHPSRHAAARLLGQGGARELSHRLRRRTLYFDKQISRLADEVGRGERNKFTSARSRDFRLGQRP